MLMSWSPLTDLFLLSVFGMPMGGFPFWMDMESPDSPGTFCFTSLQPLMFVLLPRFSIRECLYASIWKTWDITKILRDSILKFT